MQRLCHGLPRSTEWEFGPTGHAICNSAGGDKPLPLGVQAPQKLTFMGLLKLLMLPVSAPLAGGQWVLQTILDEAKRRYYDTPSILEEMAEAERSHRSGAIDDETFDRWEEAL